MSFDIVGTGMAVPKYILNNEELSTMVDTDDEWITKRTGIKERHICTTENIADLCREASLKALEDANVTASELDLIIVSTITPQYSTPAQACVLQADIGATCQAFDINAACSGYIYALDLADAYFKSGKVKTALIVSADTLSSITDWTDRSSCILFGDGAGATVLKAGNSLKSIKLTTIGNVTPLYAHSTYTPSIFSTDKEVKPSHLTMDGKEIYKFAVNAMAREIKQALEMANVTQDEVAHVIPHQANIRIINSAISKLDIAPEKFIKIIENYGNTSSSCMPMAIDIANKSKRFKKGDKICMCGFGAGLTTGSCVIEWKK